MDSETQNIYSNILSIAEKIDNDLMQKENTHENVKELLRMDLRDFLIFLTIADHTVAKDEIRYINKSLGYDFDNETLKRYTVNSPIMQEDFLNHPPRSMKYFLDYSTNEECIQEAKYYDIKKLYIMTFQAFGEDFLSACHHMDVNEVNQLTRYRFMLESKINAFTKNGGITPHRPDSIPFKRKEKTIEEEVSRESDIPFIGNISGGHQTAENLDSLLEELDQLIGLDSVKAEVKNLINLLKIIELRKKNQLKTPSVTKHFIFTGNPGTGKTTVARLLSKIYCSLGILSKGHIVEVDRSGMVAAYMGQTAIKVKDVIDKATGGVLFIDEAYSLSNETAGGDFGQEAIDALVKSMEDNRENLIVIVAGYPDLMNKFIDSNPGLKSRFQKTIHFPDYDAEELFRIFNKNCKDNDYRLSENAAEYLMTNLKKYVLEKDKNFGNARDIRNFFDSSVSAQANRLLTESETNADALMTLLPADLAHIFS